MDTSTHTLGSCCICETENEVRNILMLHKKSPSPGRGWGCLQCGLPNDGAVAVLCDQCLGYWEELKTPLKFACKGYAAKDGRVPFESLVGTHDHDLSKHPELSTQGERRCRKCGCTDNNACMKGGVACHWVEPDLCSACDAKTKAIVKAVFTPLRRDE